MASPIGLARPFFGAAIATFCAAHPDVELIWSSRSDEVHPLRDGFDIVVTEQRVVDPELVARKAISMREVCVAAPSYLARRGRPQTARELADHDVLVLGSARTHATWPLTGGGSVNLRPRLRCNDYGLLLDAAAQGLGLALLPQTWIRGQPSASALEPVLDGVVGLSRDGYICYARTARRRRMVRAFVRFALDYVKRHPVLKG